MRVSWLADVLRGAGLQVVETSGWKGRGSELTSVQGVVCHHTATSPSAADDSIAKLLINGRPDLRGPLAQLGLDRTGRYWVIADGKANHAGFATYVKGMDFGNSSIGIEAFNSGLGEPWSSPQLAAYAQGAAAICKKLGLPATKVVAHRECDPNRKIDPAGIHMDTLRSQVERWLTEEDDMFTDEDRKLLQDTAQAVADLKQDSVVGAGQWDTGKKNGLPVSGRLLLERVAQRLRRVEEKVTSSNPPVE